MADGGDELDTVHCKGPQSVERSTLFGVQVRRLRTMSKQGLMTYLCFPIYTDRSHTGLLMLGTDLPRPYSFGPHYIPIEHNP